MTDTPTLPNRLHPALAVLMGAVASCGLHADIGGKQRAPTGPFTVGRQPSALIAADFDGDGRPDLAVTNQGADSVSVLLNRTPLGAAAAGFATAIALPAGAAPVALAAGDLDLDGHTDLVVANRDAGSLTVLRNTGRLPLGFVREELPLSGHPAAVALATLEPGQRPELLVLLSGQPRLLRLRAAGGSYALHQGIELGAPGQAVEVAEIDGHEGLDLAVTSYGANRLRILCNRGAAGLQACAELPTGIGPVGVRARDLDGDGRTDLISASRDSRELMLMSAEWTEPAGALHFSAPTVIRVEHSAAGLGLLDIDGDGAADLVSIGGRRIVAALRNPTSGRFLPALAVGEELPSTPTALAVADFNTDGHDDLAITLQAQGQVAVRLMPPDRESRQGGAGPVINAAFAATAQLTAGPSRGGTPP